MDNFITIDGIEQSIIDFIIVNDKIKPHVQKMKIDSKRLTNFLSKKPNKKEIVGVGLLANSFTERVTADPTA